MGRAPADIKKKARELTTVHVLIERSEDGKPKISLKDPKQNTVRISLDDAIRWEGPARSAFWIVFEDRTPFHQHAFSTPDVSDIWRPLQHGRFKYHIVLNSDRKVRLDPVIVVDPPPYP